MTTLRGFICMVGAGALALGAPAVPCLGQSVPVGAPALGNGAPPSFVTETIGWRGAGLVSLAEAPLAGLLQRSAVAIESEWAPLYRGRDGSRVEQAQHHARFTAPVAGFTVGGDFRRETSTFRGGESDWGFDAGGAPFRTGSFAAALARPRMSAAVSGTVTPDGRSGLAAEANAGLAPGWRLSVRASDVPRDGTLDVRWEDRTVAARGDWSERQVASGVDGTFGAGRVSAALESFDRRPHRDASVPDGFEPRLAWRGARLGTGWSFARARVSLEYRHGEGRQRIVVSRGAQPYAVIAGPVREDVGTLVALPARSRWEARAWLGRSLNSASGSLALWPFDGLAALAGTRYAARSDLALRHAGIALDGHPAAGRGWDAGLALWALDPSGEYESWRATFFGLGRDDYDRSPLRLNRALAAGIRIARTQPLAWLTLRFEAVQWAPLWVERERSAAAAPSPGPSPAPPGAASGASKGGTWGGTVLRLGLSTR